jgi:hypothetical protein
VWKKGAVHGGDGGNSGRLVLLLPPCASQGAQGCTRPTWRLAARRHGQPRRPSLRLRLRGGALACTGSKGPGARATAQQAMARHPSGTAAAPTACAPPALPPLAPSGSACASQGAPASSSKSGGGATHRSSGGGGRRRMGRGCHLSPPALGPPVPVMLCGRLPADGFLHLDLRSTNAGAGRGLMTRGLGRWEAGKGAHSRAGRRPGQHEWQAGSRLGKKTPACTAKPACVVHDHDEHGAVGAARRWHAVVH